MIFRSFGSTEQVYVNEPFSFKESVCEVNDNTNDINNDNIMSQSYIII